ncbi:MAG: DUF169 domain-containing protein [Methanocalculaceae archaeon]|jgi:uncharacterized protein (DUF169 family)|nr:DUF169 domain-containing protein [Methanocalculaceae archaeon]
MDGLRSVSNFAKISVVLEDYLDLSGSPVAVKIATSPDQIPTGIPEIGETVRHCKMISLAREGRVFYATDAKHQCSGGAWALGLRVKGATLASGEHYYRLGKYESVASSRRTMENVPNLPQETYATVYAPLGKAEFSPSAVLLFAKPKAMLKLAQTTLYRLGGSIYPRFSGVQSMCSDATAYVVLSGKPNFSLGCDGSRKFSGIADEEMVAGFPAEMIGEIAAHLPTVANAAGSKK